MYITKWPIKILSLEAILSYGTVLNLVNLVRNEVLARYFNAFFIIWSFFFFLPRSPVRRFIFLLFLRDKKETVILVKGFRIKKNYILSKSNACKPWVLMRLVKIRKYHRGLRWWVNCCYNIWVGFLTFKEKFPIETHQIKFSITRIFQNK